MHIAHGCLVRCGEPTDVAGRCGQVCKGERPNLLHHITRIPCASLLHELVYRHEWFGLIFLTLLLPILCCRRA